ncbi:hypothetical protein [Streptomyces fagopyri]|uniref:hypothetical protein n=1 Tax=Streptomyces fagopyri TaxID=2662397 RepID=UPI0038130E6B
MARVGGLLGAAAAFVTAAVGAGPPVWVVAGFTGSVLALLLIVLLVPSETPARRLGHLIQAWRNPAGAAAGPTPVSSGRGRNAVIDLARGAVMDRDAGIRSRESGGPAGQADA